MRSKDFRDILQLGTYLPLEEFLSNFDNEWERMSRRLFKFEALQYYDEGPSSPYHAYLGKDFSQLVEKLKAARTADEPFFHTAAAKGVSFIRLHAVKVPFSQYLQFECYSYVLSEKLGEQIYFIEEPTVLDENAGQISDFIQFDDAVILVHDYDASGALCGGWRIDDQVHILSISTIAESLLKRARPFSDFFIGDLEIMKMLNA